MGRRRLARTNTLDEVRQLARRTTPRPVFDYVDGGAEDEIGLARDRRAFENVEFRPRVLNDVGSVDPSSEILGTRSSLPLALAPTGFTRLMHHEGELAVARAAHKAGLPFTLSTMGTTSIEAVAATGAQQLWFQLYVSRDRDRSMELIERARRAGYRGLLVTVDVPVAGLRLRDLRNGFTIPPALGIRSLASIARFPSWWIPKLTTAPLAFEAAGGERPPSLETVIATAFDPAVSWRDLGWIRDAWSGPLVVKGIQRCDDAKRAIAAGADAIVVSSHGSRQLDRARPPLELLSEVVAAIGPESEVLVDSGIRSGADVVAAIGLGARACLIGRAYLYGLMAHGEEGVDHVLGLFRRDVERTMALLGASRLAEIDRSTVSLRR